MNRHDSTLTDERVQLFVIQISRETMKKHTLLCTGRNSEHQVKMEDVFKLPMLIKVNTYRALIDSALHK